MASHHPISRRTVLTAALTTALAGSALAATGAPASAAPRQRTAGVPAEGGTLTFGGLTMPYPYLSRAAWGADESLRFDSTGAEIWPTEYFPAQAITVHHTATDTGTPIEAVQAAYRLHTVENGWGDIGYQLLIDPVGRIYEGRVSGPDHQPVFGPDGKLVSNGGHALGYNAGNIGICVLGDFTAHGPSAAALRSLTYLLAGLCREVGLAPTAMVDYLNPVNHQAKRVEAISGHRQWVPTECPGETFYPTLDAVRKDAAALLS